MDNKQIDRIKYYEKLLNQGENIIKNLNKAIDDFKAFESKFIELDDYYSGDERWDDIHAEEQNLLPKDMTTGVLAEDYLDSLLIDFDKFKDVFKNL